MNHYFKALKIKFDLKKIRDRTKKWRSGGGEGENIKKG